MCSQQDNMQTLMSNIQNKNTLYVNFNKRKREYIVIPIIPIGEYLYIYTKTTLLITLLVKNIAGKIFNQKRIQKEKYEMKGEK